MSKAIDKCWKAVLHVSTTASEGNPRITMEEVAGFVANATGRSKGRVHRARQELKNYGNLVIP
jgi:hypothetical protein